MSVTITTKTNSRYLNPYHSKVTNSFPDPNSFSFQYRKEQSYFIRNYYHYEFIKSIGGDAYFYTLTYNNKSLPHWFGIPTCDNRDLRWFIQNSGFRQYLWSNYQVRLAHFITTEFGDGKGSRGKGNHPHYHAIFYLWRDDHSPVSGLLTPQAFKLIVERYWQGDFNSPQQYNKGIVMPGDNLGLLNSPSAIRYVCKYVIKDQLIQDRFRIFKDRIYDHLITQLVHKRYFEHWFFNEENLESDYIEDSYNGKTTRAILMSREWFSQRINRAFNLFYKFKLRNVYSHKVFMSQGIGLAGVDFIDETTGQIAIPDSKKVITKIPSPLYLFRKKFTDTVKTPDGTNKYILNEKGIQLRLNTLNEKLLHVQDEVSSIVSYYCSLPQIEYPPMADVVANVRHYLKQVDISLTDLFQRYASYTLVYKDRVCQFIHKPLNIIEDYRDFLQPDFFLVEQDQYSFHDLSKLTYYNSHKHFRPYAILFDKIDRLISIHAFFKDKKQLSDYNLARENNRILKAQKYKS